jgi:uncharacterized protein YndB with AHSA1/START domain
MGSVTEQTAVVREVSIAARPETVWEFLVDPEKATRWMGIEATLEPEPGGTYRVTVLSGNVASGQFVEVDRPRRLVLTWGWEPSEFEGPGMAVTPGSSTIEIDLEPEGDGTRLRFVHRDLPTAEAAASHAHGWDHYLDRLVNAAAGKDPGRDTWLDGAK